MEGTIYSSRVGRSPTQQVQQMWADFNKPKTSTVPQSLNDLIKGQRATDNARNNNVPYQMSNTVNPDEMSPQAAQGLGDRAQALSQDIQTATNPAYDIPGAGVQGAPQAPQAQAAPIQLPTADATVSPQSFQMDKPPTMPSDPTNGTKVYDPDNLKAGSAALSYGFQNNLPEAQSPVQAQTQAADHDKLQQDLQAIAGSKNPKTAWKEVKKDPFYKDSDFYTGLMNTGLAIMSGANPMEAFQAGKSAMDKATLGTQLGGNKQALIDQGYSPASIDAAITSGDVSKLKMQEMSDQDRIQAQGEAQAKTYQYTNDLEQTRYNRNRADKLSDSAAAAQADANKMERNFENNKVLYGIKQEGSLDLFKNREQFKADLKQQQIDANGWKPDRTELSNEKSQWAPYVNKFGTRATNFATAEGAIEEGRHSKDKNTANANFKLALEQATQALIGGQRSIDEHDLAAMAGQPGLIDRRGNDYSLAAGFTPTQQAWDYLGKLVDADKRHTLGPLKERMVQRGLQLYDQGRGRYSPEQATMLINQGSNIGVMITADDIKEANDRLYGNKTDRASKGAVGSTATSGLTNFE